MNPRAGKQPIIPDLFVINTIMQQHTIPNPVGIKNESELTEFLLAFEKLPTINKNMLATQVDIANLTAKLLKLEGRITSLEHPKDVQAKCAYEVPFTNKSSTTEEVKEFASDAAIRNHQRITRVVDILEMTQSNLGEVQLITGKPLTDDAYVRIQSAYLNVKRALEIAQGIK